MDEPMMSSKMPIMYRFTTASLGMVGETVRPA
jgi:hypothetical protein